MSEVLEPASTENVTFNDIAALHRAKQILTEAVLLPLLAPELFEGLRQPWRGVLLFGPPGTGKTMLAKAMAVTNDLVFINCSAAALVSRWRGDSEKIVRCMFDAARYSAPSIIFVDEVDALISTRGGDNEHEASRRMKTELFTQMDGILGQGRGHGNDSGRSYHVMILATTNCPWDLDAALLRRLEKRVHISLPDFSSREEQFDICLKKSKCEVNSKYEDNGQFERTQKDRCIDMETKTSEEMAMHNVDNDHNSRGKTSSNDVKDEHIKVHVSEDRSEAKISVSLVSNSPNTQDGHKENNAKCGDSGHAYHSAAAYLASLSEGYSSADIQVASREAAMAPMRRMLQQRLVSGASAEASSKALNHSHTNLGLEDRLRLLRSQNADGRLDVPPVTISDFEAAILATKPSVDPTSIERYYTWAAQFSSE